MNPLKNEPYNSTVNRLSQTFKGSVFAYTRTKIICLYITIPIIVLLGSSYWFVQVTIDTIKSWNRTRLCYDYNPNRRVIQFFPAAACDFIISIFMLILFNYKMVKLIHLTKQSDGEDSNKHVTTHNLSLGKCF